VRTSLSAAFCDKTGRISEAFLVISLLVRDDVAAALQAGRPIVALESTVIAHGLPRPQNLETARAMEAAVREEGAIPATIAITEGRLVVGLSSDQLATFAATDGIAKVSRADLAAVRAARQTGATTVATTMLIAALAGIRVFATGGIGGVHRGAELSFDISADLPEIARTPVAVVCAGAKAILDLPRTLEMLETLGVPVVGYRTNKFPAFYVEDSGLPLQSRVDAPAEAARLMQIHWELGVSSGIVFCNPPPSASALRKQEVDEWIARALQSAAAEGIRGKVVTPYLLEHLAKASQGQTLETNIALLVNNARVAAHIAKAYSALDTD
jgi:pseudouridine-5'-phosphate glycosidase